MTNLCSLVCKQYEQAGLAITHIIAEPQNAQYGGARFRVNEQEARFRVAKITPKKVGQFVAFWYKKDGVNTPYSGATAPAYVIIHVQSGEQHGQFIFPNAVLQHRGILASDAHKGKMAMRVYPSWDVPTNKQAIASQKWQLRYFVPFDENATKHLQARFTI